MSNGLKLLLISTGTLITCIVISLAMTMAKAGRRSGDAFCKQMNELYADIDTSDITMYDGLEVYGSDVVNFMKRYLSDYAVGENGLFTIVVITSKDPYVINTYRNNEYIKQVQDFSDTKYIKPLHRFKGEVVYNGNDVIISVTFTICE